MKSTTLRIPMALTRQAWGRGGEELMCKQKLWDLHLQSVARGQVRDVQSPPSQLCLGLSMLRSETQPMAGPLGPGPGVSHQARAFQGLPPEAPTTPVFILILAFQLRHNASSHSFSPWFNWEIRGYHKTVTVLIFLLGWV